MSSHLEVEIKLPVADLEAMVRRLQSAGATEAAPRVLEDNHVLDFPDGRLREREVMLRLRLVEIVVAKETSPGTVTLARDLVKHLGKEGIVVRDAPGFATSRLGLAIGLEAMRMLEEGVASAEEGQEGEARVGRLAADDP